MYHKTVPLSWTATMKAINVFQCLGADPLMSSSILPLIISFQASPHQKNQLCVPNPWSNMPQSYQKVIHGRHLLPIAHIHINCNKNVATSKRRGKVSMMSRSAWTRWLHWKNTHLQRKEKSAYIPEGMAMAPTRMDRVPRWAQIAGTLYLIQGQSQSSQGQRPLKCTKIIRSARKQKERNKTKILPAGHEDVNWEMLSRADAFQNLQLQLREMAFTYLKQCQISSLD